MIPLTEQQRERDDVLEKMWESFRDIPVNPDTERIEEEFAGWSVGAHREDIWLWFDERHSKGAAYLAYKMPLKKENQLF